MESFWNALTRRRRNDDSGQASELARVLNLFDLTALGVGSTLGLGVYVLAGSVAYEQAGPAVVLSFLVAAVASAFAGLCYAEFAGRVPKAGSAYVYSYVTVGEFVAFTIGWNLILEYVIGTSSVARGLSGYIDALMDNKMQNWLREVMPIDISFLGKYPDLLSFAVIMLLACILAIGVRESSFLNNIFTTVNMATICIVIVAGAIKSDPANWKIPKESIPDGYNGGEGGFMPFGLAGVMAGAAKCFYGFVGFDCVATTGEEAINPQKNIPLAIVISLIIIFLSYFGISTVLTMMWPYYLQDPVAPFPHVFQEIGWIEIKWIVTIGAIFALCTCLLGAMFPLPRVLYAMSTDGIIFKKFKKIHARFQTPVLATIISGLLAATMAMIFDLNQLIDMMSIGTLLAYTIVSICVLVLRYQSPYPEVEDSKLTNLKIIKQIFNTNSIKHPNSLSSTITKFAICIFSALSLAFGLVINLVATLDEFTLPYLIVLIVLGAGLLLLLFIIVRQPPADDKLTFKVPFVPYIPCLSVLVNLYLMVQLDANTWIRFSVWGLLGYIIYFVYGIRYSTEGALLRKEKEAKKGDSFNHINHISVMPNERSRKASYTIASEK